MPIRAQTKAWNSRVMEELTPKIGRKNSTTGISRTLAKVAILKEAMPPIRDFIASFPSLYRWDTDTVIPTHKGPHRGGKGAKNPRRRFLNPHTKLERLELKSRYSSFRNSWASRKRVSEVMKSPKAMI